MRTSFILVSLFLLSSFAISTFAADWTINKYCSTSLNYSDGSTFQSNVNQFLSSIPENTVNNDRFYNDSIGEFPNEVYGTSMCSYDETSSGSCTNCLAEASANITRWCPHNTNVALSNYECIIIFSNENFYSVEPTKSSFIVYNMVKASDLETFKQVLSDLMDKLLVDVASSPNLLAVGEAYYTSSQKIYGLVECTRDLSASECQKCLEGDIGWIPGYCPGIGCRMFGPSCHLRYEVNLFYTPMSYPPSPSPQPQGPPPRPLHISYYIINFLVFLLGLVNIILRMTNFVH